MSDFAKNAYFSDKAKVQLHPKAANGRFGILTAKWNTAITQSLKNTAQACLQDYGVKAENIFCYDVPGCYELPLAAQMMLSQKKVDAVICLGCLIKGETTHFELIAEMVAQKLGDLSLKYEKCAAFGVITAMNQQQAIERSTEPKHGNKGEEAALAALEMYSLSLTLES